MQLSNVDERPSLILTRIFPVAPEKVWRAWTDPDALRIWWNQADSPGWIGELDVRAGGPHPGGVKDAGGGYEPAGSEPLTGHTPTLVIHPPRGLAQHPKTPPRPPHLCPHPPRRT